jgi:hypothetical protein
MKNLLLFFLLSISSLSFAQDTDKTVSITVSGSGKTQEEAKQSALRSAIEQAFGTFISSKTEILNDQVVADQMASVANGNIQSYTILNESQLPDSSWGVTLKAMVSVSKLTSFVEAKGIAIEIKGGMFALNIKQQLLNEQGEIKILAEMVGLLHGPMQISFDYSINSGKPKSVDDESKNWEIPLTVTATCNKNIDFCANYLIRTLDAISLSPEEVTDYKGLNKKVFPVYINYNGEKSTFYLRTQRSINILNTYTKQWEFYTHLFTVKCGMSELYLNGEVKKIHNFSYSGDFNLSEKSINFLTTGQQAASFFWNDKRTISQIEKMSEYAVKPTGIVSQYKYGGFVVFEENGHGLVAAITDLGEMNFYTAKAACEELILNGYSDWHLPTKDELSLVYRNLNRKGVGGFFDSPYWSSSPNDNEANMAWAQYFNNGIKSKDFYTDLPCFVRAVRTNGTKGTIENLNKNLNNQNCDLNYYIEINCNEILKDNFQFKIYNRWGNCVFATSDPYFTKWNGYFNGKAQDFGYYIFSVNYTFIDGTRNKITGDFKLGKNK